VKYDLVIIVRKEHVVFENKVLRKICGHKNGVNVGFYITKNFVDFTGYRLWAKHVARTEFSWVKC
jgi:hypothetical protein